MLLNLCIAIECIARFYGNDSGCSYVKIIIRPMWHELSPKTEGPEVTDDAEYSIAMFALKLTFCVVDMVFEIGEMEWGHQILRWEDWIVGICVM